MVRYTTDDWQTWGEERCLLIHGTLWHFWVPGIDQSAIRLQFCISYGRSWDNNGGRNFVLALPVATPLNRLLAEASFRVALLDKEVTSA